MSNAKAINVMTADELKEVNDKLITIAAKRIALQTAVGVVSHFAIRAVVAIVKARV